MSRDHSNIFVVLGMHKSGTTLVAQMLHMSGINMIDENTTMENVYERKLSKPKDNEFQRKVHKQTNYFFERVSTNKLNQEILLNNGAEKTENGLIDSLFLPKDNILEVSPKIRKEMKSIIVEVKHRYQDWGFKDPRTCLTYLYWDQLLPDHKIIVVYRHFFEILHHYKVYDWHQFKLPRLRKVIRAWVYHNQRILDYLNTTHHQYLIINYKQLMTNENEFNRLGNFIGKQLVDNRNPDLYRSKVTRSRLTIFERLATLGLKNHPNSILKQLELLRRNN
jgi:hypothetical protein